MRLLLLRWPDVPDELHGSVSVRRARDVQRRDMPGRDRVRARRIVLRRRRLPERPLVSRRHLLRERLDLRGAVRHVRERLGRLRRLRRVVQRVLLRQQHRVPDGLHGGLGVRFARDVPGGLLRRSASGRIELHRERSVQQRPLPGRGVLQQHGVRRPLRNVRERIGRMHRGGHDGDVRYDVLLQREQHDVPDELHHSE